MYIKNYSYICINNKTNYKMKIAELIKSDLPYAKTFETIALEAAKGIGSEITFQEIANECRICDRILIALNLLNFSTISSMSLDTIREFHRTTRDLFDSKIHEAFFDIAKRVKMTDFDDNVKFSDESHIKTFLVNSYEYELIHKYPDLKRIIGEIDVLDTPLNHTIVEAIILLKEGYTIYPSNEIELKSNSISLDLQSNSIVNNIGDVYGPLTHEVLSSVSDEWCVIGDEVSEV